MRLEKGCTTIPFQILPRFLMAGILNCVHHCQKDPDDLYILGFNELIQTVSSVLWLVVWLPFFIFPFIGFLIIPN